MMNFKKILKDREIKWLKFGMNGCRAVHVVVGMGEQL